MTSFNDFGLAEPILRALAEEKYVTPTPIQAQTIPLALARPRRHRHRADRNRQDRGLRAADPQSPHQPSACARRKKPAACWCCSPTRELSGQIADSFRAYGRHIRPLAIALAIGGVPINRQVRSLSHGVEVLVATPGRLLDLVNQRALRLDQVEVLVLDEADRMLDMGFIHDIKRIVAMLPQAAADAVLLGHHAAGNHPARRRRCCAIRPASRSRRRPRPSSASSSASSSTDKAAKPTLLAEVLKTETIDRVLVFTRTKHGADKVVRGLEKAGHSAEAIHGNKSQNQRERVLAAFRDGKLRTLIATDIAARGIDVDGVSHVVNYDLPNIPESYVHRIGRTARAGADGIAISFCDHEERAVPARHRAADPHVDPLDRPPHRQRRGAARATGEARHGGAAAIAASASAVNGGAA